MASCSNCKANVGCGCQLTNGLCYYCDGQKKKEAKKVNIPNIVQDNNKNNKNAIPKAR